MAFRGLVNSLTLAAALTSASSATATDVRISPVRRCAPDAVPVGTVCLDKYEASVWRVPDPTTANASLVRRIQLGRATRADLIAGGATLLGASSADFLPCTRTGQSCADDIYAVSLPGVVPSVNVSWFQALEACANSRKRLPTNAEWQMGVAGTPDPGPDDGSTDCNTATTGVPSLTGARGRCVSAAGAFDMVGNLAEWVAEWMPASTDCPGWAGFSDDEMCLSGADTTAHGAAALVRGGAFIDLGGPLAGPLAIRGTVLAFRTTNIVGFRCAR